MKASTHDSRRIPFNLQQLEVILESALEHASPGWHALEQKIPVNRINPDSWPPKVEAEVGSMEYHISAVITYIYEAFQMVTEEADHTREVSRLVDRFRKSKGV